MPSILSDDDKETVQRTVPKPANKIHAVAVARLYVAYPNPQCWTYTGLQGAAVLANDLVGNTYWLKLVDISVRTGAEYILLLWSFPSSFLRIVVNTTRQPSSRGVIWDQEIYESFSYNQDRTFFHSFELEDCLAGFSIVDEKEARQFKKKVDEREKNASKATRATPFRRAGETIQDGHTAGSGRKHSLLGGFGSFLHPGRASSPSNSSTHPEPSHGRRMPNGQLDKDHASHGITGSTLNSVDPSWKGLLDQLLAQGITEEQIEENQDFIKSYIEQNQTISQDRVGSIGSGEQKGERRERLPPPPPPPAAQASGIRAQSISPQNTGGTATSRRGPPPAPPPSRRSRVESHSAPSPPLLSKTPSPPPDLRRENNRPLGGLHPQDSVRRHRWRMLGSMLTPILPSTARTASGTVSRRSAASTTTAKNAYGRCRFVNT